MPFFSDAAILSRMRSEVTSRSNWAKDRSTLSVSRPIEVVVLNCWVTETNDTPWVSKSSTSLAKSANDPPIKREAFAHSARSEFLAQRFAERQDMGLGRIIHRHPGARQKAGKRTEIKDTATVTV